jgi:hypothetical protein
MSSDSNTNNLLGLARTAQLAGNQEEALGYFNRVLEADPSMSDAWMGKGKAAGWLSSLANIRVGEAMVAFGHAIATAPDADKAAATAEAVEEVNRLVVALYGIARQQLEEFVALSATWVQYLNWVAQLLEALEQVKDWAPQERMTLENIVHLCKDNIEGISYNDPYDYNASKSWQLSPEYEALLKSRLDGAVSALREIDPGYAAPAIQKKTASDCFVVTATMGEENHPTVKLIRRFRDEWLVQRVWGKALIGHYYRLGPGLAHHIAPSESLRRLSYFLVVAPAAFVAKQVILKGEARGGPGDS